MKSLEELVAEFKREVLGEEEPPQERPEQTEQPEQRTSSEGVPVPQREPPVSEQDFDLVLDVDLQAPAHAAPGAVERQGPPGPSANLLVEPPPSAPHVPLPGPSANLLPDPRPFAPPPRTRPPQPEPEREKTGRSPKARVRRPTRGVRRWLVVALAAILGGGVFVAVTMLRDPSPVQVEDPLPVGPPAEQDVVTWAVWDPEVPDTAFITAITGGGDLDPIALGIPAYTVVNIPGYGLATVGDAVARHEPDLVAVSVENIIGVRVDAWEGSTIQEFAAAVDRVDGIEADGRTMDGAEAVRYLIEDSDDAASAELRFLRWQEIVDGLIKASAGRAQMLADVLQPEVAAVIAAAGAGDAVVLELPVSDIGSGLARADQEAVDALVAERFVPTSETGRVVRLVVMNGVGKPGIGERVARTLIPSGFRLVSLLNAPTFDVQETQIIAADSEFLEEADVARRLLGVGTVYLGEQPTGVADVTVIIGSDFGGQ